jgi:hypothetical protein
MNIIIQLLQEIKKTTQSYPAKGGFLVEKLNRTYPWRAVRRVGHVGPHDTLHVLPVDDSDNAAV